MKRFHMHVSVEDLAASIRFYSTVFAAEPAVRKDDYAKWMLEDPRINFAISQRGHKPGLDHLGFQVDTAAELKSLQSQLQSADANLLEQVGTTCCYARADKYWATDPSGIAWESYHTLSDAPMFGDERPADSQACCPGDAAPAPTAADVAPAATAPAAKRCC